MASRNFVELLGNVGADPEVRSTTNDGRVATFTLATTETWRDDNGTKHEKTEWHRLVVWNRGARALADLVEKYVHKGDRLLVVGKIRYRSWQDRDGQTRYSTEIEADELVFLSAKRETAGAARD